MKAEDLARMDNRQLADIMRTGYPIDPHALDDTEYHGVSLGLPALAVRLSWKTFIKTFHRDPMTRVLRGWNVRIRQDRPERYQPVMRRGRPHTFGHFHVLPAAGRTMPRPCADGLLLDYGAGGRWQTTSALRDPIVAVTRGSVDLLLGWSYLDLGVGQLATPSYFSLQRGGPLSYIPDTAR